MVAASLCRDGVLVHFLRFELRGKGWKARLVAFRFSVTSVLRPLCYVFSSIHCCALPAARHRFVRRGRSPLGDRGMRPSFAYSFVFAFCLPYAYALCILLLMRAAYNYRLYSNQAQARFLENQLH